MTKHVRANPLIDAVIACVEFFDLGTASEIDPDAAERQLECVASILKRLEASEKQEFAEYVGRLTAIELEEKGGTIRAAFLSTLVEYLGLQG